jgi:2-dehydropantoate 2-reductase
MRVAILGAGAMGCVFGAAIAKSGVEVVLLDVDPQVVAAINSNGIALRRDGIDQRIPAGASSNPGEVGAVELLIVFVKGFHTRTAALSARSLVTPDSTVVTLQNGLGNGEALADVWPAAQIVVGVTAESGTTLGPGAVDHPGSASTYVGSLDGGSLERADMVADVLGRAGFEVSATDAIATEMWKKLVVGASTLPAPALAGMACGPLIEHAEMSALVDDTAREVVGVARALGHPIDPDERVTYIRELLLAVPQARGSMVQDIAAGRRTEIDTINGAVVRAADDHGVSAPINRALVALVKGWEAERGLGA